MDMHISNGLVSTSSHCLSENAEINIDSVVTAVAKLNARILQLREDIVTIKSENNIISSVMAHNLSSPAPSRFNDSMKNGENRTGARNESRRNFKEDDSPGGTDLSARLSFTKRAREVKATNEVAVFKEDRPRDDKSIEDDERPNRSRAVQTSGTTSYRRSISDAKKFGGEIEGRPGDVRTSRVANERIDKHRNKIVYEKGCDPANPVVFTSKIKRKRISRGVQCALTGYRNQAGRFFLNCFRLKSRRHYISMRKAERKRASASEKFDVGLRDKINRPLDATGISDKSRNVIKEEMKATNDRDMRTEKFERLDKEEVERITYENDKKLIMQIQNVHNRDGELKENTKYCSTKVNFLERLRLRRLLTRKNDLEARQNELRRQNYKEEIAGSSFENKGVNGSRKHENNLQSVKVPSDREVDSSNGQKSAIASSNKRSDVNKIKERLDLCIIELNGIIGDACAVFGNQKNAMKNNDLDGGG